MKKLISVLICFVLLFSLCACGSEEGGNSLEKITLCLDWTPNTNHTGFFVAEALGYYEEIGLDVTIVQPPENGAELMTASGKSQFGISFQDSLAGIFASDSPLEITAVATILQHNTSGIISRKGEGCDTPKGLEGKKYSTWNGPIELAIIENVMEAVGADYSKLELIPNVVTNEAFALSNKETDAIWIYYAWAGIACEMSGLQFDYFKFTDINEVFDYYTPVIVANNEFLKEKPEIAKAFLEATERGYRYAIDNPEGAAEILVESDTTGSLSDSLELVTKSQKWISAEYISDSADWGIIDDKRWDGFFSWLYEENLIEKQIPSGFGFSNEYLAG